MADVEFTFIQDLNSEYDLMLELLERFKERTGITVKLTRMEWGEAWDQLSSISTYGQGADLSHVGSTWVSSLVSMNALHTIPEDVIARIDGEDAFIRSTWDSVVMEEDRNPWSIPLSTYTYAIAYRRDLLAETGLNGEMAFATPAAIEETICTLEGIHSTEKAWLMPYNPFPYSNDIVHTAASWVWSSGGQLIDNRGKKVLFDSPATLAGLKAYFKLLRRQAETESILAHDTMARLLDGSVAAVLTDVRAVLTRLQENTPKTRNIGTASVMSIPWSGGSNLVVWRHTYGYPDHLEDTFKLIEFLTSKETMLEVGRRVHTLPARVDALDELIPEGHPLRPVVFQLVSSGRTHRSIRLWRRIEHQFGQALDTIAREILQNKNADLDTVLTETMSALTKRLNLTLE